MNEKGDIHRLDGPARTTWHADGFITEEWMRDGKRYREGGLPAEITYHPETGVIRYTAFMPRTEAPTTLQFSDDGKTLIQERWESKDWWLHRTGGMPALRCFSESGVCIKEEYHIDGAFHRDPSEGPASIRRDAETGRVIEELYHENGRLHRPVESGPAVIWYDPETGEITHAEYYLNNESVALNSAQDFNP